LPDVRRTTVQPMKATPKAATSSEASSTTDTGCMFPSEEDAAKYRAKPAVHLISINMNPATSPTFSLCVILNSEVERCQQEPYVLNAMAGGQSPALSVAVLAAGASQASSSVSANSAMEAADVAATFAVVQQKLNRTHFED
jgi:hypothetical protein